MELAFKDHTFGIFVTFIIPLKKKKNSHNKKNCMYFFLFRMHNMIFVSSDSVLDLNYYFLSLTLKQHIGICFT